MEIINFTNINDSDPYEIFLDYFLKAQELNQENINAIAISSFNKSMNEVDSRFVNLKEINNDNWIFYSNYLSKKAEDFHTNNQISIVIFWSKINVQIRMKAYVKKINKIYSDKYFKSRDLKKNALAICSNQSKIIESYKEIEDIYSKTLSNLDCSKRPTYWGGYSFSPYYFEFWEGHESRINKRLVYNKKNNTWNSYLLAP
jgi:pyridoxamine 5'-phosphate oxidase